MTRVPCRFSLRMARLMGGVVAVALVVNCGEGKPSNAELRRALAVQISRAWEIDSFDVESSEDVGVSGAPLVKTRFDAQLHARENTYVTQRMEGDVALIKSVLPKGERRSLFGVATSSKSANGWQTTFSFESNAYPPEGQARSELAKRTVLIGSDEERRYRLELEELRKRGEAERRAEIEAHRRVIFALVEEDRVFECEQVTASRMIFECRFDFVALDAKTGNVVATNRWFSRKTGVLKPQNRVSGTLREDRLHLTEQVKRSEAGKNFTMHYTLSLSKAQDVLVGEFIAPGGKGTMRLKL